MLNESPDKLKLKNRAYPWYLGTTFFVYKTPTGKTNYVSSTSSGIDFTLKVNGMDFSKFVPVEMRTQLDHENLVEVLHSLNEKLINKNESRRSFVASGRLWKINSQNYVSFWNEKTNVQKSILDKLMLYLNITYDNTLFEFPSNQNDYKPYDQVGTTSTITKDIDLTPHLDAPMLPAAYAKELRRLKSMNELTRKQWQDSQSTGFGDGDHPINHNNPHHDKLVVKIENAEMAQSDITKIIDYSEKLQSMFTVNDNLEDWVKAKLNHACDYVATVRDYLKFYNEEKQKGTQDIQEKWSNKYKKSIDCSNAKGFSQIAHCRARELRKAGKTTKSKPVRESYKIAISELLKEQDSSMAMGALKQLNNDAKELESMLQPNTQLEDWVKAKLNLAGEYLDDVYHHLDHFGPQGRTLDEGYYEDKEAERLKRSLKFAFHSTEKKYWVTPQGKIEDVQGKHEHWIKQHDPSLVGSDIIATYDNAIKKGYIRVVLDSGFLTLSNLPNFDFSIDGDSRLGIPPVKKESKDSIIEFIKENNISLVGSGKGKLIGGLFGLDENIKNDDELTKSYIEYAKNTIKYLEILKAIKDKFRKKADIGAAIRLAAEKQNIDPNYITLSAVKGILIGLGERNDFTNLSPSDRVVAVKLQSLSSVALTHNDGILIKILDLLESDHMNEDLKKTLGSIGLAGLTALGSLGIGKSQADPVAKPQIVKTATNSSVKSDEVKLLNGKISDYIAHWEGKFNKMYLDTEGKPTIGIGHYLNNTPEDRNLFKSLFGTTVDYDKVLKGTQSLDNNQVEKLFNVDVKLKEKLASKKISGFSSFPQYIKNAIINALYRGDLGPKTIGLINKGNWKAASEEYLNHKNAKSGPTQTIRRMKTNALAFNNYDRQSGQIKEISLA